MKANIATTRAPMWWVPSLYFAQGLPFAVVMVMAGIMYKRLGIANGDITYWTSLLGLAWVVKPLWSPLLELSGNKKTVVVLFQGLGGLALIGAGLTLRLPGFFVFSVAALALAAMASSSHDVAADGLYIQSLSPREQAVYAGWLGTFWNGGKLFVQGALVVLAGQLEASLGVHAAWSLVLALPGAILCLLALYHWWAVPGAAPAAGTPLSVATVARTTAEVLGSFFRKPGIWLSIVFIVLFRAGEGQVQSIGRLFLIEARGNGGLGMSTADMGLAYGTFASVAFVAGSILGGYFGAWRGLRKSMFLMILAMNAPNLTFCYLSVYLPSGMLEISAILCVEMFGFGFGSTGLVLYMMQVVAPGKYPTAHYALGTGIMQLGLVLSTMVSGKIQLWLGYQHFFIWGVLAAVPVLLLSLFVALPGKEAAARDEAPAAGRAVSA
ncbi:MFS transporter [Rugamonas rubra]|nr:MFS transporter [Rugamonas rubra]